MKGKKGTTSASSSCVTPDSAEGLTSLSLNPLSFLSTAPFVAYNQLTLQFKHPFPVPHILAIF